MTIQWGDTGRVVTGPLKTFNLTMATPRETLVADKWKASTTRSLNVIVYPTTSNGYQYQCTTAGTSGTTEPTWPTTVGNTVTDGTITWTCQTSTIALPTVAPASSSAQVSYTIQQSDLPSFSPQQPYSMVYTPIIHAAGWNGSGASQTVYYNVYKNGTSVRSGSQTVASGVFWTQAYGTTYNCVVGDVISITLYSTSANVNLDYYSLQVYPTRMVLSKSYICKDVTYSSFTYPALTLGNPADYNGQLFQVYFSTTKSSYVGSANITFPAWHFDTANNTGAGFVYYGDSQTNMFGATHATYRPYYTSNNIPTSITLREILR